MFHLGHLLGLGHRTRGPWEGVEKASFAVHSETPAPRRSPMTTERFLNFSRTQSPYL